MTDPLQSLKRKSFKSKLDMGEFVFFKPFKFKKPRGKYSGESFTTNGIFHIVGKERNNNGDWICTIQRIATCHLDSPIGETRRCSERFLLQMIEPASLESFD